MGIVCLKCRERMMPEMKSCPKCGSQDRKITVNEEGHGHNSVTIKKRVSYSLVHILAAAYFARQAYAIESGCKGGDVPAELLFKHQGYVSGCISSAVSFLEATINELFADAVDNPAGTQGLDQKVVASMATLWKIGVNRLTMLEKFDIALVLGSKNRFDRGAYPAQDVVLIIRLRNALVHYEPEWVEPGVTVQALEMDLKTKKFALNPLTRETEVFFPFRCLSHGCAEWAVTSSRKFINEFCTRMGVTPRHEAVRPLLNCK